MKKIVKYRNGNYIVTIYEDGTKTRSSNKDLSIEDLKPKFPESIDLKITNKCTHNCPFCYESSKYNGKDASLEMLNNKKFIKSIHKGTELAIGGGNPVRVNDEFANSMEKFLIKMKKKKVICNITWNPCIENMSDFLSEFSQLMKWQKMNLIKGIGVSLSHFDNIDTSRFEYLSKLNNVVYHTIAGISTAEDIIKIYNYTHRPILVLGYKTVGRGASSLSYKNKSLINLYDESLHHYSQQSIYDILVRCHVSFDNLAIEQLELKKIIPEDVWAKNYLGKDGNFSMYIDLVRETYSDCSLVARDNQRSLKDVGFNIRKAFEDIRKNPIGFNVIDKSLIKKEE